MKGENKNSLIYIVLPVYNWEKYFLEQLMSIYYQSYTNWFLIIINDWSTDNSENIAKKFISDYELKNKVKIIKKENWGLNSAITRWLEEIKKLCNINDDNNLVCYCDCDDAWTRNKLETQINYMRNNPWYWLSYNDLMVVDENWMIKNPSVLWIHRQNDSFLYIATVGWFVIATMMFKAKYIDDILPMPIWKSMAQDYWTALVLSLLNVKILYINKQLWIYRDRPKSMSKDVLSSYDLRERRQNYYKFLQERFPDKDLSYVIKCNQDRMVNRRKNWKPLIYAWIMLLIKYPKVFFLYFKAQLYKLYMLLKK